MRQDQIEVNKCYRNRKGKVRMVLKIDIPIPPNSNPPVVTYQNCEGKGMRIQVYVNTFAAWAKEEVLCFDGCEDPEVSNEILTTINSVREQITNLTERLEAWRGLQEAVCLGLPDNLEDVTNYGQVEIFLDRMALLKLRGLGEVERWEKKRL